LLDRIDLHVEVPVVKYQDISSGRVSEPSSTVRERVIYARQIQIERFRDLPGIYKNADMNSKAIRKYCELNQSSQDLLKMAMNRLGLSARAYDRILKVARTIADLSGSTDIGTDHISEAIQYRSLDREYWR
jgi:magnesium chelatase family protein